jgi:NAD(P)-dependent dehydrogenase (short-subunit alcohol dehydrogenase family)
MFIEERVAVVTGTASGIGQAVARELVQRGVAAVAMVDRCDSVKEVASALDQSNGNKVHAVPFVGDVTDDAFRRAVFDGITTTYGVPSICVPAAGITRDNLAVRLNKETGTAMLYPIADFMQVLKVNLVAPAYWALALGALGYRSLEGLSCGKRGDDHDGQRPHQRVEDLWQQAVRGS